MKTHILAGLAVISFLTAGQPILAEEGVSRLKSEDMAPESLREMGLRLNPQLGVSSFEHSKQIGTTTSAAFGVTAELGRESRKLETGLMVVDMGSSRATSRYLTIPMMAKIEIFKMRAQNWYAKAGFNTAYEISSTKDSATNNLDILAGLGLAGRLAFNQKADLVIEATYNRGLLDNLRSGGPSYNQGILVLTGLSFRL